MHFTKNWDSWFLETEAVGQFIEEQKNRLTIEVSDNSRTCE